MTTEAAVRPDATATSPTGINTVAIIGFGAMGSGIAHVCALAGKDVRVVEMSAEAIERDLKQIDSFLARGVSKGRLTEEQRVATMGRIKTSQDLSFAHGADLVIEAVTENLKVKQEIFQKLDANMAPTAILASNTSALSVTEIAAGTNHPERICGLHFFNPAPVLPLVEVIRAERTSEETMTTAYSFVQEINKEPIVCGDTPGFVVNRILIPLMNDVARIYESGVASAEDIDKGCRYGLNWPIGPLALCDLVGLDVHVHASEALWEAYREPRFMAPPILQRMVKAGKLGRKSGAGFYDYSK